MEIPTVESVTNLFAKYGELTQIRIIRPSSSLPTYLKEFTMWVPDLGVNHCAIVEFETQEQAQAACREINMINRADGKLRVALLKPGARIRRTLYRKYKEDDEIPTMTTKKQEQTKEQKKKDTQKKQKTQLNLKVYNSKLTQLDSGNGSDGSAEASHSSEDETSAIQNVSVLLTFLTDLRFQTIFPRKKSGLSHIRDFTQYKIIQLKSPFKKCTILIRTKIGTDYLTVHIND